MADVASKQQTTALFLSTKDTRTIRHAELTKKLTNLMGNLCCAREHSVQFFVKIFYTVKLQIYLRAYGALNDGFYVFWEFVICVKSQSVAQKYVGFGKGVVEKRNEMEM